MPAAAAAPAAGAIILFYARRRAARGVFCLLLGTTLFTLGGGVWRAALGAGLVRGRVWAPSDTSLTRAALTIDVTDFCPALLLASVLLTLATRPLRPETQEA